MTAEWSRIYLEIISVLETSSKVHFGSQNGNFHFFENLNFQFSSITHFFHHKFPIPSFKSCSYRPYGPFWFSVKNGF